MTEVVANVQSATARSARLPTPRPRASGASHKPERRLVPVGTEAGHGPQQASVAPSTIANGAPVPSRHIVIAFSTNASASEAMYGWGIVTQRAISGSWQTANTAAHRRSPTVAGRARRRSGSFQVHRPTGRASRVLKRGAARPQASAAADWRPRGRYAPAGPGSLETRTRTPPPSALTRNISWSAMEWRRSMVGIRFDGSSR